MRLLFLAILTVAACTGDERPPPSSPHDPASPQAAEAPFDAGSDPLSSTAPTASAPPATDPHAGHQHGGAH